MPEVDKIIYRSKLFPEFVLKQSELDALREAFPQIREFHPIIKQMELKVMAGKAKKPDNLLAGLLTWCKKEIEIIAERKQGKPTKPPTEPRGYNPGRGRHEENEPILPPGPLARSINDALQNLTNPQPKKGNKS